MIAGMPRRAMTAIEMAAAVRAESVSAADLVTDALAA